MRTLRDLFVHGTARPKERHLLWRDATGQLQAWSTAELVARVDDLANALRARGLNDGDRVALLSRNSARWAATDWALVGSGLVTVPIYPTLAPDQVRFILDDSGARGLFLEDHAQIERLGAALEGSSLEWIVLMSDESVARDDVHAWTAFGKGGSGELPARTLPGPDDLASVIYTSGTTGRPKGVMLTHGNLVANALACDEAIDLSGVAHLNLSLLPLCHIFQRLVDYLLFMQGATMAYCADPHEAAGWLREVRPTFFAAVPRIFEKVHATMQARMAQGSPAKQALARWAVATGRERFHAWYRDGACDGTPSAALRLRHALADALVLRKLRAAFGGRIDVCFSGGGPLTPELHEFFRAIGLALLPGYGLTETSPVLCTNTRTRMKLGSVGPALPGVDLRVEPDGELLASGPNVMKGYWNRPEETAASLQGGWLRTGDLARIDARGCVSITGRKKELIVLTTGKKVVPAAVEERMLACPLVSQAVLVGDERKFVAALVWPDMGALRAELARRGFAASGDDAEILASAHARRVMQESVDASCASLSEFERPKSIVLLPRELTQEEGELTPTLKLKRKVIVERWADLIEQAFGGRGAARARSVGEPGA